MSDQTYEAVIVHYDNDQVYGVLDGLDRQEIRPRRVLVVDNSASIDPRRLPLTSFPVELIGPAGNRGYAAAVNEARSHLSAPYLLLLTHEAHLEAGCARLLGEALQEDDRAGSAGPVLRFRSDKSKLFSGGGRLDSAAWPSHASEVPAATSAVDWIDGSVMMLRRAALDDVDWLDERYFLYFEEIDLAARLVRGGWQTLIVRQAVAYQEPGGFPPFLAVRNRILFVRAFPERLQHPYALFLIRVLAEIAWVARRRGLASIRPSLAGFLAGIRGVDGRPDS